MQKKRRKIVLTLLFSILALLKAANSTETNETLPLQSEGNSTSSVQSTRNIKNVEAYGQTKAIETTLRLLDEGEREIQIDPNYRDVVLVVGNTGAGKPTMTQFLAGDNANLISYEAEDGRYLIRDAQNKTISVGGTLVSHSIFPELVVDPQTNTAFYDCPGFSDTRNASVEIANAFFIKKVADHAQGVKLLFVINYSSLQSGETRTGFKTLIEQATNLIDDPKKFHPGISLIATKVESSWNDKKIVTGIAKFLTAAKRDLTQILEDQSNVQRAHDLIDALLTKDAQGSYNRIGFFRQPEELGLLSEMEDVQDLKTNLEKMVFKNTEFVPKNESDFRVGISDSAQLLVANLGEQYNNRLSHQLYELGKIIQKYIIEEIEENIHPFELLPKLHSHLKILQQLDNNSTSAESSSSEPISREQLLGSVLNTMTALEIPGTVHIFGFIESDLEVLQFLEKVRGFSLPIRHSEWTQPLAIASDFLSEEIFKFERKIDEKVGQFVDHFSKEIVTLVRGQMGSKSPALNSDLSLFSSHKYLKNFQEQIINLLESLPKSETLSDYFSKLAETAVSLNMTQLSGKIEDNWIIPMNTHANFTIILQKSLNSSSNSNSHLSFSPFRPADWTLMIEKSVLKVITSQNFLLSKKLNDAVQKNVQILQVLLNDHFSTKTFNISALTLDETRQLYENFTHYFSTMSNTIPVLRKSQTLNIFSIGILEMLQTLANNEISPSPDFLKFQTFFQEIIGQNIKINLEDPIDMKASPFKLFEWISLLEKSVQLVQDKIGLLSRRLEEGANKETGAALMEQIKVMQDQMKQFWAAKKSAEEKHALERKEWEAREAKNREKERLEEKKREEDRKANERQLSEMQNKFEAEMKRRDEEHRRAMERIRSQRSSGGRSCSIL